MQIAGYISASRGPGAPSCKPTCQPSRTYCSLSGAVFFQDGRDFISSCHFRRWLSLSLGSFHPLISSAPILQAGHRDIHRAVYELRWRRFSLALHLTLANAAGTAGSMGNSDSAWETAQEELQG